MPRSLPDPREGVTARQMMGAPRGAVFVWCSDDLTYPRYLARKHGREDLSILPLSEAQHRHLALLRDNLPSGIVVDHEARLDRAARKAIKHLERRIARMTTQVAAAPSAAE